MPLPRQLLFFALPACLVPGLLLAATTNPAPIVGGPPGGTQYTIQPGDTLTRIAQKHGVSPDALAQANAIEKSQRIIIGNVLRLPVDQSGNQPAGPRELPAVQPLAPPPTEAAPGQSAPVAAAPAPVTAKPARAEAPVPPPAQVPGQPKEDGIPDSPARLASGVYTNPVLGTLRLSQTATGLVMTRDNQVIAMRHLLYGIFDGSDSGGVVHGVRLEFDGSGQVTSLLYSSGSAKEIPFTRAKK